MGPGLAFLPSVRFPLLDHSHQPVNLLLLRIKKKSLTHTHPLRYHSLSLLFIAKLRVTYLFAFLS